MTDPYKPDPESVKRAWHKHNQEHFHYFRTLDLRTKLEAVQGMADIVRRFQDIRAQRQTNSNQK